VSTSVIERGKRLERLRNMANLTRIELCTALDFSINTYKNWELGRFRGLTTEGCEKVLHFLSKKGVICTTDWLLFNEGMGPYSMPELGQVVGGFHHLTAVDIISHELNYLSQFYKDILFTSIVDDGLSPEFIIGDMVAGIKVEGDAIKALIGHACIIYDIHAGLQVRYIKPGTDPDKYHLFCTNLETSASKPIEYDVNIHFAARIIRRYQPSGPL
jgi:transcriptional regulator with XRE-family HTH domain